MADNHELVIRSFFDKMTIDDFQNGTFFDEIYRRDQNYNDDPYWAASLEVAQELQLPNIPRYIGSWQTFKKEKDEQTVKGLTVHTVEPIPDDSHLEPWSPIVKNEILPAFPLSRFPEWVQNHINQFAASTGVHKDYCAAAVLGTISAVTVGHCDIFFNMHYEPIQLYSLFVGNSGTMKSSVISHFLRPAVDWLSACNDSVEKANYAISEEIKDLEKQYAAEQKSKKSTDKAAIIEKIEEKRKQRRNYFPVPYDDVTPESLINAMRFSRGTANIATSEGNIINVLVGRSYTQKGSVQNIDAFLKGADGEPIHTIRVTSGKTDIKRADISMLLAIQPNLLERLCTSADASGRGLAQRFLIYNPSETFNSIDHTIPVQMDPVYFEKWSEHIKRIAAIYMDPDSDTRIMNLAPAADRIIREFWNHEAKLIKGNGSNDSITGWFAKCHGKALRIAALLTLLNDAESQKIRPEDADNAVALFKEYYIPHYISAFENADLLTHEQKMIHNWFTRFIDRTGGKYDCFSENEAWKDLRQRGCFHGINGRTDFNEALYALQELNYIRVFSKKESGHRGRPAKIWQINPELICKK